MEKIIGINPVIEAIKVHDSIEKIEIFKGVKKQTISQVLELASKKNIKVFYTNKKEDNSQGYVHI